MLSTYRRERQFGIVLACIAAVLALWPLWSERPPSLVWSLASAGMLTIAWLRPALLAPVTRAAIGLGHILGVVNTYIILMLVFFLMVTPVALWFRITGRDLLGLKQKHAVSHWQKHDKTWSPESFKKQY